MDFLTNATANPNTSHSSTAETGKLGWMLRSNSHYDLGWAVHIQPGIKMLGLR